MIVAALLLVFGFMMDSFVVETAASYSWRDMSGTDLVNMTAVRTSVDSRGIRWNVEGSEHSVPGLAFAYLIPIGAIGLGICGLLWYRSPREGRWPKLGFACGLAALVGLAATWSIFLKTFGSGHMALGSGAYLCIAAAVVGCGAALPGLSLGGQSMSGSSLQADPVGSGVESFAGGVWSVDSVHDQPPSATSAVRQAVRPLVATFVLATVLVMTVEGGMTNSWNETIGFAALTAFGVAFGAIAFGLCIRWRPQSMVSTLASLGGFVALGSIAAVVIASMSVRVLIDVWTWSAISFYAIPPFVLGAIAGEWARRQIAVAASPAKTELKALVALGLSLPATELLFRYVAEAASIYLPSTPTLWLAGNALVMVAACALAGRVHRVTLATGGAE